MGPGLKLQSAEVEESTLNYLGVRDAFLRRAGFASPPIPGSNGWKTFIEGGFGYVDERCNAFIDALYWADREKQAALKQTTILAVSTAAIMGHAGAAARALNIVADAFGLVHSSLDNFYNSVLFNMPPSTIQTTLDKVRKSQRDLWLNRTPASHLDEAAAMTIISDYLAVCLPANLEARIENTLNETSYVSKHDGTVVPVAMPENDERMRALVAESDTRGYVRESRTRPIAPFPTPGQSVVMASNPLGIYEQSITQSHAKALQRNLCVPIDGNLGGGDSRTREAVKLFKALQAGKPDVTSEDGIIYLETDAQITSTGPCESVFLNVFEKREWANAGKIKSFHEKLAKALATIKQHPEGGKPVPTKELEDSTRALTGLSTITEETRKAIRLLQTYVGRSVTGQLTLKTAGDLVILAGN